MNEKAKRVYEGRVLWRFLKENGWSKQKEIKKATGLEGTTVRAICSEFAGHFVSNTVDGYNVTVNCSADSIEHSINDLRSRCQKMEARARALEVELQKRYQHCFEEDF